MQHRSGAVIIKPRAAVPFRKYVLIEAPCICWKGMASATVPAAKGAFPAQKGGAKSKTLSHRVKILDLLLTKEMLYH